VAWVLPRDGRLLRVTPTGRARMVRAGVRAIAATGTELWAVAAGGRAVVRLDPGGGCGRRRRRRCVCRGGWR
jgi:hypothetical protein